MINFEELDEPTESYTVYEEAISGKKYAMRYDVKKEKINNVIEMELYNAHKIPGFRHYKIASRGLRMEVPEFPFFLPVYRKLYRAREFMFSSRYNGIEEEDNHWWTTDGYHCDAYTDVVPYQITHNFYSAMTREIVPKASSNFLPFNTEKANAARWLDCERKDDLINDLFVNKGGPKAPIENTEHCRDFLLALICQISCIDTAQYQLKQQYAALLPALLETKEGEKIKKTLEKELREKMIEKAKDNIKKWFDRMCGHDKFEIKNKVKNYKKTFGIKSDSQAMLEMMCTPLKSSPEAN